MFEGLLVGEELLIVLLVDGSEALLFGSVVCDIDVLVLSFSFLLVCLCDVTLDFLLHLLTLGGVTRLVEDSVSHLDDLETEAAVPLAVELVQLLILVEGRGEQLLTPVGSVDALSGIPDVLGVLVLNDELVVTGEVESPDVLLIETVVNDGHVGIRGVCVGGFTLHIVEVELLIVVLLRDGLSITNGAASLGVELLQAFPVVVLGEVNIVDVIVELGVLLDRLVEALEGVI